MRQILILTLAIISLSCEAPDPNIQRADKHFEKAEYQEAIAFYEKAQTPPKILNEKAREKLEESYYRSANNYYKKKNFNKAIRHFSQLLTNFPDTAYKEKAVTMYQDSRYQVATASFAREDYHKSLDQLYILKKQSDLPASTEVKVNELMAKSLYHIATKHLKQKKYYIATQIIKDLIQNFPESGHSAQAKSLLEECLFLDGENQYHSQAYKNSLKSFKEQLSRYPTGTFSGRAKEYINKIRQIHKTSVKPEDKSSSLKRSLEDFGLNPGDPYTNDHMLSLYNYFKKERLKNMEVLKHQIFPIFIGRHVSLKNLKIESHREVQNSGLLTPGSRKAIDNFIGFKAPREQYVKYKYIVYTKTTGDMDIFMTKKDFFRLDFSRSMPVINVIGTISTISLKDRIRIYISSSFVEQVS